MKQSSIYAYFAFGYNYNIWEKNFSGSTVKDSLSNLKEYLGYISSLELNVTEHIVFELHNAVKTLDEIENKDEVVSERIAKKITKIINSADKTLDAELQLKKVHIVTPKRFNLEMLMESPAKLLGDSVWEKLSNEAKKDFKNGALCISLNLPTAGAFHFMRCVEEMLKQLYFCYIKQNRLERPMWGNMIDKLKKKKNPKPKAELLDQLDIIRKNFRNPTQHPEKFYSIDEAQDLLNSSIVAINMIVKSINDKKA